MGLSSPTKFIGDLQQNTTNLLNYAKFKADYVEIKDGQPSVPVQVELRPCTVDDFYYMDVYRNTLDFAEQEKYDEAYSKQDQPGLYGPSDAQKNQINAHIEANQFWCPNFPHELSLYNQFDNDNHKVVNIYLSTCFVEENPKCVQDAARKRYFEGKQLMLLSNS